MVQNFQGMIVALHARLIAQNQNPEIQAARIYLKTGSVDENLNPFILWLIHISLTSWNASKNENIKKDKLD